MEVDENYDIHLQKISNVLSKNENFVIETDLAEKLQSFYSESKQKFKEFDDLLEKIHSQENGSMDSAFFYTPFSRWCVEFITYIKSAYGIFIDKLEIQDIIKDKETYKKLLKDAEQKTDAFQKMLNEATEKKDSLLLQMEQIVSEKNVLDIKVFYQNLGEKIEKDIWWHRLFYYGLSVILLLLLAVGFLFYEKIYGESFWIQRSVMSISFIGVITFLINDFRKRYNIEKQILDEIEQKKLVVDTYSSLLSRIDSFDDEIKESYHKKIVDNIVSTLLSIKNHGYFSKVMNQNDSNMVSSLVEGTTEIVKAVKGK